jgi:23S rRNA pseudouridine1911/1915/1917 synthase
MEIIFENNEYLVVDKPAGVLVHPTLADEKNTLVDFLMERYPNFKNQAWTEPLRAGIIHRLDKETSGLIILAKNPLTLEKMQKLFKSRQVKKTYQALVVGHTPEKGKIDIPLVRDNQKDMMKTQAISFSFSHGTAREAVTAYRTIARYKYKKEELSLIEVYPQTGRMHQIRVHMKYEGYPLIGDQMYFNKPSKRLSKELGINRQFLHAVKLEIDGQIFKSKLANDLKLILDKLKVAA